MDLRPYIESYSRKLAETEVLLSDPQVFANQTRAQELAREYARLKQVVADGRDYLKALADREANQRLSQSETDPELLAMAQEEGVALDSVVARLEKRVQAGILPPDPADSRNTIVEIRAGAGGSESALFAADLYRMFCRYAEGQRWKVETMDSSPSDLGGFKDIVFGVSGTDVYRRLKFESGVHRVQRVPATEAQGRIHTSTATVAVLPEAEEVEVEIKPEDLHIEVCRAGGHGGQGVNTTDSAVRIVHKPTGLEVRCQDERSQLKNKAKALKVLRTRLLERSVEAEKNKYDAERSKQVGTGERSEKIRTYNFPQNRVTDHRIDLSIYNLPVVLDGDLDCLIEPLIAQDLEARLKTLQA
jgi:peptide chain release factor 1